VKALIFWVVSTLFAILVLLAIFGATEEDPPARRPARSAPAPADNPLPTFKVQ
jgi:hypothetical protein